MAKIYWENDLFPQFLQSIDSVTLSELSNLEIQNHLNNLAKRAIVDFKYPDYSLDYEFDDDENPETGESYGYYFVNENIGQRELNVILARMKVYWIDVQLSQERNFKNDYYDVHVRLHSPGNMIAQLVRMRNTFKNAADEAERRYYSRNIETGEPRIGGINE